MNLFKRKVRLFCVSNLMLSFMCTGLLGINGYANVTESTDEAHEISLTASDTEPVSHNGEGEENIYAFVTKSIEAIIGQQADENSPEEEGDGNDYANITYGIEAVIEKQEEKKEVVKTVATTKKKTTSKKTTSVVTKKEVATTNSYSKPSYSSVTGDAVVSFAKQFMGLKYVHAGRSLSSGTDCSGFTMLIYREFGVNLPPTVSGQVSRGKYVAKKDLQKGDLVFYKAKGAKGGASHVGIYIGGGLVIHESRPGVGVKVSTVNMMQYVTARRVINSTAIKIAEQKLADQNKDNNTTPTATPTPTNNTNTNTNTTPSTPAPSTPTPTVDVGNNTNENNNNEVVNTGNSESTNSEPTNTPAPSTPAPSTPVPSTPAPAPVEEPTVNQEESN